MSFQQLWSGSIQLDEKLPTNWFSINPFKAIWLHFQLSPPAQILWWCSHTRRGDATFVSQQVHFHSTTVQQISLNILPPGGKLGQKMALKIVRLWIQASPFKRCLPACESVFGGGCLPAPQITSPSPPPSSLKLPKMCHSRMSRIFFLPPFFFLTQFRGEHTLSGAGTKAGGLSPELWSLKCPLNSHTTSHRRLQVLA